jgi:hypothetical protein
MRVASHEYQSFVDVLSVNDGPGRDRSGWLKRMDRRERAKKRVTTQRGAGHGQ